MEKHQKIKEKREQNSTLLTGLDRTEVAKGDTNCAGDQRCE